MSIAKHREIWWSPAWDKRNDPGGNYGIHGLEITFVVRNKELTKGLTFCIMTNWWLPHNRKELENKATGSSRFSPIAGPVAIHVLSTADADQVHSNCEVVGGPCNGRRVSCTLGQEFFDTLVAEGQEALWKKMEDRLAEWEKDE